MKKISFLFFLFVTVVVEAQNNAIFDGNNADGWSSASYTQTTNDIFRGGTGDGWTFSIFLQTPNAIFAGGAGDGWTFSSFLQPGNAIFNGGQGDGWNYNNFLQPGNAIFSGGQGDGWASTYRPLGVLPVTFLTFTAEKQGTASLLKWQTSTELNTANFEVERSSDALVFNRIGIVSAAGNSSTVKQYDFIDQHPTAGANYYRLRQVDRNGAFHYTPTRMLLFGASALQTLKVYPVPATALLTVELPQQFQSENFVLNLSNAAGVMVRQIKVDRSNANRQILNISTLPPGVYTLQVSANNYNAAQTIIKL